VTLSFEARVADRGFDLSFAVAPGETVAVLGPNGAGKSTLLNLVAGLVRPDAGRATLDGEVLFDTAAGAFAAPHIRGISMLAQDALLFPHLSVLENVAFGPRSAGARATAARSAARDWLAEVDALDLAERRPAQLSGGQAQRIAVARALASEPRLLLLDEPMAALDVSVAPAIRRMLRRVLEDRAAIVVTHDILDAFTLADRVLVLDAGGIVDEGATREVLERPRIRFTAGLAGLNLLTGVRTAEGLVGDSALADGVELRGVAVEPVAVGAPAAASIRPSAVQVSLLPPPDPAGNRLRGIVRDLEPRGDLVRVRAEALSADVTPARAAELDLAAGTPIWFAFPAAALSVYSDVSAG
jgi:molybdate transport system ATP-binding protein